MTKRVDPELEDNYAYKYSDPKWYGMHYKPTLIRRHPVNLTLDAEVVARAKAFARSQNLSLSRVVEILLKHTMKKAERQEKRDAARGDDGV